MKVNHLFTINNMKKLKSEFPLNQTNNIKNWRKKPKNQIEIMLVRLVMVTNWISGSGCCYCIYLVYAVGDSKLSKIVKYVAMAQLIWNLKNKWYIDSVYCMLLLKSWCFLFSRWTTKPNRSERTDTTPLDSDVVFVEQAEPSINTTSSTMRRRKQNKKKLIKWKPAYR